MKNILIISPSFHNKEILIYEAALKNGTNATLFSYNERELFGIPRRVLSKISSLFFISAYRSILFGRINNILLTSYNNNLYKKIIQFIGGQEFDSILIIKGYLYPQSLHVE